MRILVLLSALVAQDGFQEDYSDLPRVFENNGQLYSVGYRLAGNLDKTGSANNDPKWLATGGLT